MNHLSKREVTLVKFIEKDSNKLAQPPRSRPKKPAPRKEQGSKESDGTSTETRRRPRRAPREETRADTKVEPVATPSSPAPEAPPAADTPGAEEKEAQSKRPRRRRRSGRKRREPDSSPPDLPADQPADQEPQGKGTTTQAEWDPSTVHVDPVEGKTRFLDLELPPEIMHAVVDLGFEYCTPIQAEIMPDTLQGKDATGKAQTGTGKTAAFLITIFRHLLSHPAPENLRKGTPRSLVIAPTRELALQIEKDAKELAKYTDFQIVAVFGGMDYVKQRRFLTEQHVDLVIATPGRLLDFKRRQDLHLSRVEVMVIDEADRMLDMGFIPDVRQIIHSTPPKTKRQTMLFSATLTPDVVRLARQWTRDAVSVEIEPEQVAVDTVNQIVYIVTTKEKFPLLLNIVQRDDAQRVMVFANRRDQTRKLTELLEQYGISCALLSGDVPQTKRIKTLERFREGDFRVLVATDVAGRGIHVEGVSHVVNFTLPHDAEDYVHRIGRTGRAGATGTSISFACEADAFQIPAIEEYIGNELECVHPEDDWLVAPPPPPRSASTKRSRPSETSGSSDRRPRRRRPRRSGSSGDGGGRARAPQTR